MRVDRRAVGAAAVIAFSIAVGTATPSLADAGDVSVGGVWVCRITQGASGLTAEERAVQMTKQITEALSTPKFRRGATISVRPQGPAAKIMIDTLLIVTVTPEDIKGTTVTTMELARTYPFAPHYRTVNGVRIHFVDEGQGDPVVLLHGDPTWGYLYRHCIPHLARRGRCIVPITWAWGSRRRRRRRIRIAWAITSPTSKPSFSISISGTSPSCSTTGAGRSGLARRSATRGASNASSS